MSSLNNKTFYWDKLTELWNTNLEFMIVSSSFSSNSFELETISLRNPQRWAVYYDNNNYQLYAKEQSKPVLIDPLLCTFSESKQQIPIGILIDWKKLFRFLGNKKRDFEQDDDIIFEIVHKNIAQDQPN